MADLLINLQVRKSTADAAGSKQYYEDLTDPIDGWTKELRQLVLFKKQVSCFIHPRCRINVSVAPKDLCSGTNHHLSQLSMINFYSQTHLWGIAILLR